jgi:hypothetical protein
VINPGLIMLLPFIWLIPAVIAALLWVIRSARSLATGFAAASAAWLAFLVTFWLYTAFAPAMTGPKSGQQCRVDD